MKITTIGIDLAKAVFGVHGVDERGKAVLRKPLKRKEVGIYKGLGGKGRVPPLPRPTCSEIPYACALKTATSLRCATHRVDRGK